MILPYQQILKLIDDGHIQGVQDLAAVQPASLDVYMSDDSPLFHIGEDRPWQSWNEPAFLDAIDPNAPAEMVTMRPTADEHGTLWYLPPLTMCLISACESLSLPADRAVRAEGASTLGRNGLVVHITAGHIDPGYEGVITFELFNMRRCPIILRPGMRIGQFIFQAMTEPTDRPYCGRYYGSCGVAAPRKIRGGT